MELIVHRRARPQRAAARPASRRDAPRGFTLLEVVIALGILAFGLLGLAALQIQALGQGREGRHVSRAAAIAQDRMEDFQRLDFDGAVMAPTGGWQLVRTVNEDVNAGAGVQTEMTYQVEERIEDLVVGSTKSVDVRVTWDEPNRPGRQIVVSSVRFDY